MLGGEKNWKTPTKISKGSNKQPGKGFIKLSGVGKKVSTFFLPNQKGFYLDPLGGKRCLNGKIVYFKLPKTKKINQDPKQGKKARKKEKLNRRITPPCLLGFCGPPCPTPTLFPLGFSAPEFFKFPRKKFFFGFLGKKSFGGGGPISFWIQIFSTQKRGLKWELELGLGNKKPKHPLLPGTQIDRPPKLLPLDRLPPQRRERAPPLPSLLEKPQNNKTKKTLTAASIPLNTTAKDKRYQKKPPPNSPFPIQS